MPEVQFDRQALMDEIVKALRTIYDPEIPVNIFDLGLIYNVEIDDEANVKVEMTLTAPNCPAAASMPLETEAKVASVMGVKGVNLEVVWDPPWDKDMMSEAARIELGLDW